MVIGSVKAPFLLFSLFIVFTVPGCRTAPDRVPPLSELIAFENGVPADRSEPSTQSDPYQIEYLPGPDRFVVLLRGSSEILLLDRTLEIVDRQPTPRSPTGIALAGDDRVFVCGTGSGEVWHYVVGADGLSSRDRFSVSDAFSLRDVAFYDPGNKLFLLDGFDRNLICLDLPEDWLESGTAGESVTKYKIGAGPLQIQIVADHLLINLLLEHRLVLLPLKEGIPQFEAASSISNDGNFWCFQAVKDRDSLLIAAGGIENHPLVRTNGGFGFIDSFLYLFRLEKDSDHGFYEWREEFRNDSSRFQHINLSELGVVTPKALEFTRDLTEIRVSGYGSDRFVRFELDSEDLYRPKTITRLYPGISDFVRVGDGMVVVNPLFDRIESLAVDSGSGHILETGSGNRSPVNRMGELLLFTTLIAPHNQTREGLSRFSCEACHFEGGQDGRIHFTGRNEQYAVPRTLRGLAGNVPLFSGAGDDTLSKMILAEFKVANQDGEGRFAIRTADYPWLSILGSDLPGTWTATDLRKALLAFLLDFELEPNPVVLRNPQWTPEMEKGLTVFRDRCADCHQAMVSNRDESGLPFSAWRGVILDPDRDLIWGAPFYSKTGIRPYFDSGGTRVPSLRRTWRKYPYFTNGSATTIREVLEQFRYDAFLSLHKLDPEEKRATGPMRSLEPDEIDALVALLRLF